MLRFGRQVRQHILGAYELHHAYFSGLNDIFRIEIRDCLGDNKLARRGQP